jgi:transcription initiation factor TFIID subunit 11
MLGQAVNEQVLVILCGITKLFVGEVVESARILAHRSGHHGALMPAHIHEAYQVMRSQGRIGSSHRHLKMFRSRPA